MTLAVFALTLGAIARITRFITTDDLFGDARAFLLRKSPPDSKFRVLMTCPWCMSIWVAAALAPLGWFAGYHAAYQIPAIALTCSYVYALVATNWDDD